MTISKNHPSGNIHPVYIRKIEIKSSNTLIKIFDQEKFKSIIYYSISDSQKS